MTRVRFTTAATSSQRGFTLIEVLIAVLVLAIGLLGLASLTAVSMQYNRGALLRTQATNLAYEITDAMRANRAQALAGAYTRNCTSRSSTGLAADDLNAWCNRVAALLPSGEGVIEVDADDTVIVTVRWDSSRDSNDPGGAADEDEAEDEAEAEAEAEAEPTTTAFVFRTRL